VESFTSFAAILDTSSARVRRFRVQILEVKRFAKANRLGNKK
jgi:hypothetical protein